MQITEIVLRIHSTNEQYTVFVAAVERLPDLHYSVDFIFLSSGMMGFIVGL